VPTYCAAVRQTRIVQPQPSTFDLLNWKSAHRLLVPWKTFTVFFVSLRLFSFELGASMKQTDGQTEEQDPKCGHQIRQIWQQFWQRLVHKSSRQRIEGAGLGWCWRDYSLDVVDGATLERVEWCISIRQHRPSSATHRRPTYSLNLLTDWDTLASTPLTSRSRMLP